MGYIERPVPTDFCKIRAVKPFVVVIVRRLFASQRSAPGKFKTRELSQLHLVKVFLTIVPVPGIATIFSPVIKCWLTSSNPGVVVETATSPKDFTPGVRLFNTLIVRPCNHCGFVAPIIVASSKLEGSSWGVDFWNILRVAGVNKLAMLARNLVSESVTLFRPQ